MFARCRRSDRFGNLNDRFDCFLVSGKLAYICQCDFFVLYIRLKDDKETLYLFPCLMLILMMPGSIFVLPGVFGWGYVVWVMSGMLLCADWLCSLMPHKQRLIVRLAIMICLIWAVGLIGLGQYQQNSNDQDIFEDRYFSVFYNPFGLPI